MKSIKIPTRIKKYLEGLKNSRTGTLIWKCRVLSFKLDSIRDIYLFEHCSVFKLSSSYVIFRDNKEIALYGISALSFNQILQYLYTGSITIREENVFDIFESMHFLQIKSNGDPLLNRCVKWMVERLGSSQKLNASLLVKVCNDHKQSASNMLCFNIKVSSKMTISNRASWIQPPKYVITVLNLFSKL